MLLKSQCVIKTVILEDTFSIHLIDDAHKNINNINAQP